MAISEMPTFTDTGNYQYTVDLDDVVFILTFRFNPRDAQWRVDVSDEEGTILRAGIKLVTGFLLFLLWQIQGRPLGELLMVDPSGQDREAGLETIGGDVFLTYVDQESLFELAG